MKVRVPLHGNPRNYATVERDATVGATIGTNVWNADGTLYVPTATTGEGSGERVLWTLLVGIPANVQAVAALVDSGFVRKVGSAWSAAALAYADLPTTASTAIENLEAGDYVNLTTTGVRRAKNSPGYEAHGFVLQAVNLGATAAVHPPGRMNTAVTGRTQGATQYLSSTPGKAVESVTPINGEIVQMLGVAHAAGEVLFSPPLPPIEVRDTP